MVRKDTIYVPVGAFRRKWFERAVRESSSSHLLLSYYFLQSVDKSKMEESLKEYLSWGVRLVLDSGAFSAKSQGEPIDLTSYINFLHQYHTYFDRIFILDVIGDHLQTQANYERMLLEVPHLFAKLIPVWHIYSPLDSLQKLISYGPSIIGLGGLVSASVDCRLSFIRTGVTYCHEAGIKTHALGMGSVKIMRRVNADFCDSNSWAYNGGRGRMMTPFTGFHLLDMSSQLRANPQSEMQVEQFFSCHERMEFVEQVLKDIPVTFSDLFIDNYALILFNLQSQTLAMQNMQRQSWKRRVVF